MKGKIKKFFKRTKRSSQVAVSARFAQYNTSQLLKMTGQLAKETIKSFWTKHRVASRLVALALAAVILFGIFYDVYDRTRVVVSYDLTGTVAPLLDDPIQLYADKLEFDPQQKSYIYNKDYQAGGEVSGDSYAPKIQASFSGSPDLSSTITDPVNNVSITFKPTFKLKDPIQDSNRIIYPVSGLGQGASKVYTLKGTGVKEDIILRQKPAKDSYQFSYEVSLSEGLEMRLEVDGSVGVYGVDSTLLGNVSTGSDSDAELLQQARKNGEKTQFLFKIPAPYVVEKTMKDISPSVKAWFTVSENTLVLNTSGLQSGNYPLSIDPTIYVETARKLMRGNNETNIDFDVTNELIQKSQTTGARIDAWSSTTNLSSAVYGQGTAVAGGYIYSAGGVGSTTTTTTTYNTAGSNNYVVPTGVTSVTVKTWGAGGGGGNGSGGTGIGGAGGGGGYAKAVITTTPGETLTAVVGTGGQNGDGSSGGGSGGGFSAILRSGTYLVQGGGGGGGGGSRGNNSGDGGAGGAGGGATADNGVVGEGTSAGGFGYGGSTTLTGTPSDGGAAGTSGVAGITGIANGGGNGAGSDVATCNDALEAADTGGNGGQGAGGLGGNDTASCSNGGGGGGGRFGGGGGGSTTTNNRGGGGGGGGSSLVTGTSTVETDGAGTVPGNSGDSDRGGLGDGGAGATSTTGGVDGDTGIIVISYTTLGSVTNAVYWAQFNSSTNAIESPNPGTGACTGWCNNSVYNLPTAVTGLSLVAYNGFLYAIGGSTSAGTPQTTVYIAKLGANGEPQLWHPTGGTPGYWYTDTALSNARSQFGAAAYNNRMYILGGLTTSSTVLGSNTVQFAEIRPNGTLTTWTSTGMQALTTARYGMTAHIYNDVLYALGGNATFAGTPVSTVEYSKLNDDGTMNAWTTASTMLTTGRMTGGGSFSTVFGGYMYINGGCAAVNASGYCTDIPNTDNVDEVQLASINADGSLAPWNKILNLNEDRFGHTMIAWQGGLYQLGGCRAQDSGTGGCTNTVLDVDYGVINPDGEASTVATSADNATAPCSTLVENCNLPNSSVGNMLNATVIMNGYLYIMGGCTSNDCTTYSAGVTYQSIGSDGTLERPTTCAGTYTDSYCVSSTSLPNALGAPGVAVFGGRIYLIGGFPTITNISHVSVNSDGSLGAWTNTDFTDIAINGIDDDLSYTFAYARANPNSAGSIPGNLFIFGGCTGTTSGIGCTNYSSSVYKCDLNTSGVPSNCTVTGQLQIGAITGNDGLPTAGGLGAHAGAVYANYIYLMGGLSTSIASNGTDLTYVRYAEFDDSNNVVAVSGSDWVEGANEMVTGRRRGSGFGYNGYLYVLGGYDGADAIADIEFAKINVSDGSWEVFDQSSVTIQKRWALSSVVSNSYVYVVGGCTDGGAPSSCTTRTDTIQIFQVYNNDSGAPVSYSASANQFATDRFGASSAIINGYIYVAGGCTSAADCTTATNSVQYAAINSYGNLTTAWVAGGNLPDVRAWGQLESAGGTLYYIGGQTSTSTDERPEVYWATPSAGAVTWATVGGANDLPDGRTQHGATVWNDRIYVTGGIAETGGAVSNTVYVSPDLSAGGNIASPWSSLTTFDVARSGTTAIAYANNLYIMGGYNGTNYLNDVQFTQINSDGTVDAWTFSTSLPSAISQGDGFAANGYIYLVGGRSSATNCASKTLVAPISANTTIATGNNPTGVGEWFETNVKYEGKRYGNSVAYYDGKYYVSGGVCDGFPTVKNMLTQTFAASTTHNVTMPATVNSGDLLMVLITNDHTTAGTITTPSGWTSKASDTQNTQVRASVFIKVADGTEDATNVNFATSASEEAASHTYRVQAGEWSGTTAGVEVATFSGATATTTPNPASLDPGAWGTENTLWIAYSGGSSFDSVTSYPTGFSGGVHNQSNTGTGGASSASAWQESAAASVDPGTFTMGSSEDAVSYTIGIRPASFSLTGANSTVQTAVYSQPQVAIYSRMIDTDTDVFPTSWLMNGIDNSIGARWQVKYRSMHDTSDGAGQQNPNEDCGTSLTMPLMTTWGIETNYGDTTLGDVAAYTALNSTSGNINCARYYYFYVSIDASQTFGYPEDVARGPTISDLSLFFTSDPSKRLRHGKTFTGGEQQPLDTPCRQTVDANCPLP